jgi:hypothetical protein
MLNLRVLAGLLLIPLAFATEVVASPSPIGSEDWDAIHRQMGATGKNGYRPMTSRAYQSSARFHSRALNSYGTLVQQVPVETATGAFDADSIECRGGKEGDQEN